MAGDNDLRPIIVKRKKIVGAEGHHGGAWKVAYADFVTAMMAFFLLMWLVNATTVSQRRGLADYFSPTVPLNKVSGGGDGAMGGNTPFANDEFPQDGTGATQEKTQDSDKARGETGVQTDGERELEQASFEVLEEALYGLGGESLEADELLKHIVTRVTDDGFVIDIFDLPNRPLFEPGLSAPTPIMREIIAMVSRVVDQVENDIEIGAHLSSFPVVLASNPTWDLTSDRADRVRQMMVGDGTDASRMRRITGHADRDQVDENPMAVRNNRVEVTLLRY